jgi:hypothetical protein
VAEAPREPEKAGQPRGAFLLRGDQGRHGSEVVGIARVSKAEKDRDRDHDQQGRSVGETGDLIIEA